MKKLSDILMKHNITKWEYADEMPENFTHIKATLIMALKSGDSRRLERALKLLPNVHSYCRKMVKDDIEFVANGGEVDTSSYNKVQMSIYGLACMARDITKEYGDEL